MTLEQLKELQQLSYEWSRYSGLNKKSDIETLLDLNREIQEAWESRNNTAFYEKDYKKYYDCFEDYYSECLNESFESELADIFLILVRMVDFNVDIYRNCDCNIGNNITNIINRLLAIKIFQPIILIGSLKNYCNQNSIDLYNHVKLKLKYNYSRKEYKK